MRGAAVAHIRIAEPVIRVTYELHEVVDQSVAALAMHESVYQRGGELVHIVREVSPTGLIRRAPGSPTIRSMARATIRENLTRVSRFEKLDKRSERWSATIPPDSVVDAVASRGEWHGIRPLVGIAEAPCLRPDGTILQAPGYDPSTGYVYAPNDKYLPIPDRPTLGDAQRARDELLEIVCDFPFAGDAHRAGWLAMLLTCFARPAIDGCVPLFAVDAPTRGSGKGRCVDAAANVATGRDATKTAQPKDDDEMRKRITTLVLEGEAIAVIDNISRALGDPSLDAALTATTWKDRALGRNASVSARNNLMWVATGNNIELGADTARRTLHVRIESPLENPEDRDSRQFKHPDLLAWVRAERPRLVRAAVTLLRAYFVAGCPDQGLKQWGSFEQWSRLIPHVLVWAGLPDPMSTRQEFEDTADSTKQALIALQSGWQRLDVASGGNGLTAKQAIGVLYPARRESDAPDGYDALRDAIEELTDAIPGRPPSPTKLGCQLRKARRRVIGGRKFDTVPNRSGVAVWRVLGAA
jgi:hypothetical protein